MPTATAPKLKRRAEIRFLEPLTVEQIREMFLLISNEKRDYRFKSEYKDRQGTTGERLNTKLHTEVYSASLEGTVYYGGGQNCVTVGFRCTGPLYMSRTVNADIAVPKFSGMVLEARIPLKPLKREFVDDLGQLVSQYCRQHLKP